MWASLQGQFIMSTQLLALSSSVEECSRDAGKQNSLSSICKSIEGILIPVNYLCTTVPY